MARQNKGKGKEKGSNHRAAQEAARQEEELTTAAGLSAEAGGSSGERCGEEVTVEKADIEADIPAGSGEDAIEDSGDKESESVPEEQAVWQKEKEELINQLKRAKADLDNFKRISRLEQERIKEYAQFDFFKKLLPVIDNLERAQESACREEVPPAYREGLEMIHRQLMALLEQEGVTRIEAKGCVFDPNFHHAVMQAEGEEGEPETIAEELAPGYRYKDRVLRPAMVTVFPGR